MIQEGITKIWSYILDCVFPQSCLGCKQDDIFLCNGCRAAIRSPGYFEEPGNQITTLQSLTKYEHGSVTSNLIELLKYNFSANAQAEITQWITNSSEILRTIEVDLIIPIPLHPRRQAERGFNQAYSIARPVAAYLKKPLVITALCRVKPTKQQALLGKIERTKNTAGAFSVLKKNVIQGKTCLLVDDVYTTGSTMQAAAKALLDGGAAKVIGFTLARAVQ